VESTSGSRIPRRYDKLRRDYHCSHEIGFAERGLQIGSIFSDAGPGTRAPVGGDRVR